MPTRAPTTSARTIPTNNIGVARVMHFDRDGKFINQWFGKNWGPGKFSMAHGMAVDPTNGDVWIGDRDQYRIVIYTGMGKFVKTISMRNLICAINFDSHNNPWVASGNDGQMLKLDRNGNVLGAIGNGRGTGPASSWRPTSWRWTRTATSIPATPRSRASPKWLRPNISDENGRWTGHLIFAIRCRTATSRKSFGVGQSLVRRH